MKKLDIQRLWLFFLCTITILFGQLFFFAKQVHAKIGSRYWGLSGLQVSTDTNGGLPDAVADGSGGVFIVWNSNYTTSPSYIYAQHIDSTGTKLWNNGVTVGSTTGGVPVERPQVITDGSGNIIVTWIMGNDVHAQKLNSNGETQWGTAEEGVIIGNEHVAPSSGNITEESKSIELVSDNNGGAIAIWTATTWASDVYIKAQRVNGSGSAQWTEGGIAVSTYYPNSGIDSFRVTNDGSGGAIVAWNGKAYESNEGGGRVYIRRLSNDASFPWGENELQVFNYDSEEITSNYVADVRLAKDDAGGTYVFWSYEENETGQLRGQYVPWIGAAQWDANGKTFATIEGETWNKIAAAPAPGADAYLSYYDVNTQRMTARRIDVDGLDTWSQNTDCVSGSFTILADEFDQAVATQNEQLVLATNVFQNDLMYMQMQKVHHAGATEWSSQSFRVNSSGVSSAPVLIYQVIPDTASDSVFALWSQGNWENHYTFYIQKTGDANQVINVNSSIDVENSIDKNIEYGSNFGIGAEFSGYQDIIDLKLDSGDVVSQVVATLDSDKDWSVVSAGNDTTNGKAFISGLESAPGAAETHALYIPKIGSETQLYICPGVSSLDDISVGCSDGYTLEITDDSVTSVNQDGRDYWKVTNLTGTGGMVMQTTSLSAEANDLSLNVGTTATITVYALNQTSATEASYRGTIGFSSSPSENATIPSNYEFTEGDAGSHAFTNEISFAAAGTYTITITDTNNPSLTTELTFEVSGSGGDSTPPSVPGTPSTFTPTIDTTPSWTWTASTDETALAAEPYIIGWCNSEVFSNCSSNTTTRSTNSYTHTTALSDGTWYFRVKAVDATTNESAWSSLGTVVIDTTGPVISEIHRGYSNSKKIGITWTTNEPGTTALTWKIKGGGDERTHNNSSLVSQHEYIIENVTENKMYQITVQSFDSLGNPSNTHTFEIETRPDSGSTSADSTSSSSTSSTQSSTTSGIAKLGSITLTPVDPETVVIKPPTDDQKPMLQENVREQEKHRDDTQKQESKDKQRKNISIFLVLVGLTALLIFFFLFFKKRKKKQDSEELVHLS